MTEHTYKARILAERHDGVRKVQPCLKDRNRLADSCVILHDLAEEIGPRGRDYDRIGFLGAELFALAEHFSVPRPTIEAETPDLPAAAAKTT